MNTVTHAIVASTLLSKKGAGKLNWVVLIGALLPDASIFIFYFWAKIIQQTPERIIWTELYWQQPWQTIGAVSNSIPLALALLGLGLLKHSRLLIIFSCAILSHFLLDFPFHADDAHQHFWPLTRWRFHSPLSYWDIAHHASSVIILELSIIGLCCIALWKRFEHWSIRLALTSVFLIFFGTYIYFSALLG